MTGLLLGRVLLGSGVLLCLLITRILAHALHVLGHRLGRGLIAVGPTRLCFRVRLRVLWHRGVRRRCALLFLHVHAGHVRHGLLLGRKRVECHTKREAKYENCSLHLCLFSRAKGVLGNEVHDELSGQTLSPALADSVRRKTRRRDHRADAPASWRQSPGHTARAAARVQRSSCPA